MFNIIINIFVFSPNPDLHNFKMTPFSTVLVSAPHSRNTSWALSGVLQYRLCGNTSHIYDTHWILIFNSLSRIGDVLSHLEYAGYLIWSNS